MQLADDSTLLLGTNHGLLYLCSLSDTGPGSACSSQRVWQAPGQAVNCLASCQISSTAQQDAGRQQHATAAGSAPMQQAGCMVLLGTQQGSAALLRLYLGQGLADEPQTCQTQAPQPAAGAPVATGLQLAPAVTWTAHPGQAVLCVQLLGSSDSTLACTAAKEGTISLWQVHPGSGALMLAIGRTASQLSCDARCTSAHGLNAPVSHVSAARAPSCCALCKLSSEPVCSGCVMCAGAPVMQATGQAPFKAQVTCLCTHAASGAAAPAALLCGSKAGDICVLELDAGDTPGLPCHEPFAGGSVRW